MHKMNLNLEGKSLGIIEEALRGYSAHWYEWIRSVKLINEAAGVRVRIAGHRTMEPAVASSLGAEPLLDCDAWDESVNRKPPLARQYQVLTHNLWVYRSCLDVLKKWGPVDCLQIPVVKIHHLAGCLLLTRRCGGRLFKRLVLQTNMPPGRHFPDRMEPVFGKSSIFLRMILSRFKPYVDEGLVCLGSDSDQTAKDYELLTGVRFIEFPTPRISPSADAPTRQRSADAPVVFTCLGPSRHEKGSDLLLGAIRIYLQQPANPPARFVLQWTHDFDDDTGTHISPDPWIGTHPAVTLHRRALSSEEYDNALLGSDCIVMPYRWKSYFCRISGQAVEAATAGIPVVYTENTWIDRAITRYGAGLSFRDGDIADLAAKLAEMAVRINDFQRQARARVPLAREVNSPEAFLKCFWGVGTERG